MAYTTVLTEIRGRVGLVTLNRPQAMNAFNTLMLNELFDALNEFDSNDAVGAMVVTGNEKAFAAGADIKEMAEKSPFEMIKQGRVELWGNAPMENFFGHLKEEYLRQFKQTTFKETEQLIDEYIYFYNYERTQLKTKQTPFKTRCLSI